MSLTTTLLGMQTYRDPDGDCENGKICAVWLDEAGDVIVLIHCDNGEISVHYAVNILLAPPAEKKRTLELLPRSIDGTAGRV